MFNLSSSGRLWLRLSCGAVGWRVCSVSGEAYKISNKNSDCKRQDMKNGEKSTVHVFCAVFFLHCCCHCAVRWGCVCAVAVRHVAHIGCIIVRVL